MQGFACDKVDLLAAVAQFAGVQAAVGLRNFARQLLQGDAVQGQAVRIGGDANGLGGLSDQIGQADLIGLGNLGLQHAGKAGQVIGRHGCPISGRQGQGQNRHIINAAPNDEGFGDAHGNTVHPGTQLFMHAQDGVFGFCANLEARRHHHRIVAGLRVDVFNVVDSFDNDFKLFCDQLDPVFGAQALGLDMDIHQGNRNLGLFFTRQGS